MNYTGSNKEKTKPPDLMFSHFGINCHDPDKLEDFYTRVMGYCVSDEGLIGGNTKKIIFMTRRPREHHQFVIAGGRDRSFETTIGETGFKAPNLDALRQAHFVVSNETSVKDITAIDHGISWTLYFRDPEGNRISISVETNHYVPQPAIWPLDLSMSDEKINELTNERCKTNKSYMTRKDWKLKKYREFNEEKRLSIEGPETGNPNPDFKLEENLNDKLLKFKENTMPPPKVAQSHCAFKVSNMNDMVFFYDNVLGYAVTARGKMMEIGEEPAHEYTYLSRDPDEHHQLILVSGRDMNDPTSVNQLSLRVLSLNELRRMERILDNNPSIGQIRKTCHGNSFSIYFPDPEGNIVELAVESTWYVPAPHGIKMDLSWSDEQLITWAENHCKNTPGFMMRSDWKTKARQELEAIGHLESEGLIK